MNNKTIYGDEPVGNVTRVEDFLPPPSQLIPKEETVKVTLTLSKASVEFFKSEAAKNNVSYQRMIRILVDKYVQQYVPVD
ncbi:MAG: hypothetical protein R3A44_37220 [Caldilineaceae bacterium]